MIILSIGVQNWLENVTYQMCNMSYKQQASKLAGYVACLHSFTSHSNSHALVLPVPFRQIAFLKSYATSSAQETARDAVQVFGGRGITRTGMGRHIEHVRAPSSLSRVFTDLPASSPVPPDNSFRRSPRRCRRRAQGSRCPTGTARHAQRC